MYFSGLGIYQTKTNKMYITRLTPNDNKWEKPSSRYGKCQRNSLFECSPNNYGHEEWLNRNDGILTKDGWRYGFVQAFKAKDKIGKPYEVVFYTIRSEPVAGIFIVAYCKNMIGISINEAQVVYNYFMEPLGAELATIQLMRNELINVGARVETFDDCRRIPRNILNVKFKTEDLIMLPKPILISKEEMPENVRNGHFRFKLHNLLSRDFFMRCFR